MAEYYTSEHMAIGGQRPTSISWYRWSIEVDMLTINKQLNRFLELLVLMCEICIAFSAVHAESEF